MVTPLPTIESDVLALLENEFKVLQQARIGLMKAIQNHKNEVGTLRLHNWMAALEMLDLSELGCDECQDAPYSLGLWPIGRGAWACDRHRDAYMTAMGLTDADQQCKERDTEPPFIERARQDYAAGMAARAEQEAQRQRDMAALEGDQWTDEQRRARTEKEPKR